MKCIYLATAMALAMFVAPAWALPESAEMHVSGSVTAASSCSMSISDGGYIDLGQIDYGSLSQSGAAHFNSFQRTLSITCDSPTQFSIEVFDTRFETLNPDIATTCGHCLGLGWTDSQRPIGFYGLGFHFDPIVDGVPRRLLFSNDAVTWQTGTNLYLTPQSNPPSANGRYFVAVGMGTTVDAATTVSVDFLVSVYFEGRDTMAITQPTAIDGNSFLQLFYL